MKAMNQIHLSELATAVLKQPWPFALGLALLLGGVWLLRKGGIALLFALGMTIGGTVLKQLADAGLPADDLKTKAIVYLAVVNFVWIASRVPGVIRGAEAFVTLGLCFVFGHGVADALHLPIHVVWAAAAFGALFSRVLTIGLFAAALMSFAMKVPGPAITMPLLASCLVIVRSQHGRWLHTHWDPRLSRDLRGRGRKLAAASADERYPVVFMSDVIENQRALLAELCKKGIECFEFPGGSAGALMPVSLLRSWKRRRWFGSLRLQPTRMISGKNLVQIAPVTVAALADALPIEEAGRRLRSHLGGELDGETATGKGIVVAIIDSGVNAVTEGLRRALKSAESFLSDEPDAHDRNGHGTSVASCVLAVAKDVALVSLKVLNESGQGTVFSLLRALQYVAVHRNEIQVANLSLGMPCCGDNNCPVCRALSGLESLGVVSCSAAGNSGPRRSSIECPGASPNTIGVAAVDAELRVASFSSRGPSLNTGARKPDAASYGVNLRLWNHQGNPVAMSGTSFAAPLMAGAAAGLLQVAGKTISPQALKEAVLRSCVPAASGSQEVDAVGAGVVNLKNGVDCLSKSAIVRSISPRAHRARRWWLQPSAAVATAAVLLIAWHFGLHHVGALHQMRVPLDEDLATPFRLLIGERELDVVYLGEEKLPLIAGIVKDGKGLTPVLDGMEGPLQIARASAYMIGRVRIDATRPDLLTFDDGSGQAVLAWEGDPLTKPKPGSVIWLRASETWFVKNGPMILVGRSRLQLLPDADLTAAN